MANKSKKKIRLKPFAWDASFFIGGLIMGRLIGALVKNVSFLRWLAFEVAFGVLEPFTIDLVLFKFSFGYGFYLTPAVVLFTILFVVGGKLIRTQILTPEKESPKFTKESADNADTDTIQYDN